MKLVALFFPALIAVYMNREKKESKNEAFSNIFTYAMFVIAVNVSVMSVLTYVLGLDGLTISVFESFSFFIVYTVLACAASAFIGGLVRILKKTMNKENQE